MFLCDYLCFSLLWTSFLLSLCIYLTMITMTARWWGEHILQPISLLSLIFINIFLKTINPKLQQKKKVKEEAHWPINCENHWKSKTAEELKKKTTEGDYCHKKAESALKWATPGSICGCQEQSWLREQKLNTLIGCLSQQHGPLTLPCCGPGSSPKKV